MAKKILLTLSVAVFLFFGTRALIRSFASDETRIRWHLADMEEAYNTGRPGSCVGPLAKGWRHEGHAIDRQQLLGALFQVSRDRDRETQELRSRVSVDEDAAEVRVDGDRATVSAEARFERLRAGQWEESWHIAIESEWLAGDDGWEVMTSRHRDLTGTHLSR